MTDEHISDDLPGFGEFRIDVEEGTLFLKGSIVPLRRQAFQVLRVLYDNLNKTVDYEILGKKGWGLPSVTRHNIQAHIQEVRQTLGETHGASIKTVPGKGCRLVTYEYLRLEAAESVVSECEFKAGRQGNTGLNSGMEAVIIFDGVTLNKASELLYDTQATLPQREASGSTYVRSLENFVLGVVFGGRVLSGKIPALAPGVEPVRDMISEFGEERIQSFRDDFKLKPPDLLDSSLNERPILEALLSQLADAATKSPDAWREHAIREIRGIGDNPNLLILANDPGTYRFADNFWPDRVLQEKVSPRFVDFMIEVAKEQPELPPNLREAALREYYSRNALAHVLIFRWYQKMAECHVPTRDAVFLPHATRASLMPTKIVRNALSFSEKRSDPIWRLKRFAMPYVISEILDQSLKRDDFSKLLVDYAQRKSYRQHRELFAIIVACLADNRPDEADRAVAALEKLCSGHLRDAVRCFQLSTYAEGGSTIPIAARRGPVMPEYLAGLERIFPELKLTSRPCR